MNDNARKWTEALRSGEFEQGVGYLRLNDRHCCLGVACELYRRETGEAEWDTNTFLGEEDHLPAPVQTWLGLATDSGEFVKGVSGGDSLIDRNDAGVPFTEIADLIESEPEGLFA